MSLLYIVIIVVASVIYFSFGYMLGRIVTRPGNFMFCGTDTPGERTKNNFIVLSCCFLWPLFTLLWVFVLFCAFTVAVFQYIVIGFKSKQSTRQY